MTRFKGRQYKVLVMLWIALLYQNRPDIKTDAPSFPPARGRRNFEGFSNDHHLEIKTKRTKNF